MGTLNFHQNHLQVCTFFNKTGGQQNVIFVSFNVLKGLIIEMYKQDLWVLGRPLKFQVLCRFSSKPLGETNFFDNNPSPSINL